MSITTGGSGNWSSTTNNAPWPGGVLPGPTDDVIIADGHTVTLDQDATINTLTNSGNGGFLQCSSVRTLTVTNGITYTGTGASGFIRPSNGTLIIVAAITMSGTGQMIVTSGTPVVVLEGNLTNSGSGRLIRHNNGTVTIRGNVANTSTTLGQLILTGAGTTLNLYGNASGNSYWLYQNGGTVNLYGISTGIFQQWVGSFNAATEPNVLVGAGGSFDEAARNTNPGGCNVRTGVTWQYHGGTATGSLKGCVDAAGVKHSSGVFDGTNYQTSTGLALNEVKAGVDFLDGVGEGTDGYRTGTMPASVHKIGALRA